MQFKVVSQPLDASLQKYNPLFIIPVMQMGFIFFASISGGIYFHEVCVSRARARSRARRRRRVKTRAFHRTV